MYTSETLTAEQQALFDEIDHHFQINKKHLISINPRRIENTRIINELALTYQSLGLDVIVLSQQCATTEYFARTTIHKFNEIFDTDSVISLPRGFKYDKSIILVDSIYPNEILDIQNFENSITLCPIWCGGFVYD